MLYFVFRFGLLIPVRHSLVKIWYVKALIRNRRSHQGTNQDKMVKHRMRKKIVVVISIILISITMAGCWDIKYLDELAIVIAMGMDEGKGQEIEVTIQIVNPAQVSRGASKGGGGGGGKGISTTYSETGKSVSEAIQKISNKSARRLYFSHNQVLVIGEDLANQGIGRLFDFIERDPEVRTDFYCVIAKGAKASDVLHIATPVEKIPGLNIRESINNVQKHSGTSYGVRIRDIIESIDSQKKEIAAGSIEIVGDKKEGESSQNAEQINPSTTLNLSGMAVFKDAVLIDFFTPQESKGLAWIHNKIKNTFINIPCKKEGIMTIEVIHTSTTKKVKFQKGQPSIVIHTEQEANIGEMNCTDMDLSNQRIYEQLEKETEDQIKQEILGTVKRAQKLKTDIFGFSDAVYKANPSYWKKNSKNWDAVFAEIPVQIEVKTVVRREGLTNKSYLEKVDKQ
jgi:spore germination protein KC